MILNLTQHTATPDQTAAGVVNLPADMREALAIFLTFSTLPTEDDIRAAAANIAEIACYNGLGGDDENPFLTRAMIGGAPWLMGPLATELQARGIDPVFAFSVRATNEQIQPDGSVKKVSVFNHAGFVPAI